MDRRRIVLFGAKRLYIADTFAITVKTDNAGTSNDNQFTLTGGESLGNAQYRIDWYLKSDPTTSGAVTDATGAQTITFPAAGTYVVQVASPFNRIQFNNGGDKDKLLEINQWGGIAWTSMQNAFRGCSNVAGQAIDVPDLSGVTVIASMFRGATSFNQELNWNVSNVISMGFMFREASSFNQELNWDTSSVTRMDGMFISATSFNQELNWDTSKVTNMAFMFQGASAFQQPLHTWDFSSVTNLGNFMRFRTGGNSYNTTNYNLLLQRWEEQHKAAQMPDSLSTDMGGAQHSGAGTTARNYLTTATPTGAGWSIVDGGAA